jgi:hypothetical protein
MHLPLLTESLIEGKFNYRFSRNRSEVERGFCIPQDVTDVRPDEIRTSIHYHE